MVIHYKSLFKKPCGLGAFGTFGRFRLRKWWSLQHRSHLALESKPQCCQSARKGCVGRGAGQSARNVCPALRRRRQSARNGCSSLPWVARALEIDSRACLGAARALARACRPVARALEMAAPTMSCAKPARRFRSKCSKIVPVGTPYFRLINVI